MSKPVDISGTKINGIDVIERLGRVGHDRVYRCRCRCGKEFLKAKRDIVHGTPNKSCGCLMNEIRRSKENKFRTHGMLKEPIYHCWQGMKNRCYNQNNPGFKNYGGRGIRVCDRWKDSFENFFADMGHPPTAKHSIDRIDVNGHYEPANCRWATPDVQQNNKRNTQILELNGEARTITGWAKAIGLSYGTISNRIYTLGWSVERALKTPKIPNTAPKKRRAK